MTGFIRQKHMSISQLAEKLGYSVSTLRRMKAVGDGPPWLYLRGRVYYEIEAVEAWEKANIKKGSQTSLTQP